MARPTRLVLSLGLLLAAAAAADPSVQGMFARARRALREQPAEADSPSTRARSPPASRASSYDADSPYIAGFAPSTPAPPFPTPRRNDILALPAAPTAHHGPPRAPPAPSTTQKRALPSSRAASPTCTFVTYIGGGGTKVTEVVRGGDGRVFVVGPGSSWDKSLAAASLEAPPTDAPDAADSSGEEEEDDDDDADDIFTVVMDHFCETFTYARNVHNILQWFGVI